MRNILILMTSVAITAATALGADAKAGQAVL